MLHNLSPWQACVVDNWQQNKQKCITVIVKQSFEYDHNGNVFAMQTSEEINMADEMLAEPTSSSLKTANEVVAFKKGFELYGNLTAYPPKTKQVKVIEVNISLQQKKQAVFSKTLRVTGDRIWQQSLLGKTASEPKELTATPLTYENTYGGIDSENSEKIFADNPAGKGFRVKKSKGSPLPIVEYPKDFLKHPKKQISPASYGALPLFWQPRLAQLPEIEENALMAGEYPYQTEFTDSVFNCAPQDQQLDIHFNSELTLLLKGVSPNKDYHHKIAINLPYIPPQVAIINGEEQAFIELTCDTLVMDTDANAFHLVWRKSMAKGASQSNPQNDSAQSSSKSNEQKHSNEHNKSRITSYSQIIVDMERQQQSQQQSQQPKQGAFS